MLLFDFLPYLPILLYTDENSNASAFHKQTHTLSTGFISEMEFLEKNILLFVACGGVVIIKYVLQPRVSYNPNKHLRLTAGNVTVTFLRQFD